MRPFAAAVGIGLETPGGAAAAAAAAAEAETVEYTSNKDVAAAFKDIKKKSFILKQLYIHLALAALRAAKQAPRLQQLEMVVRRGRKKREEA